MTLTEQQKQALREKVASAKVQSKLPPEEQSMAVGMAFGLPEEFAAKVADTFEQERQRVSHETIGTGEEAYQEAEAQAAGLQAIQPDVYLQHTPEEETGGLDEKEDTITALAVMNEQAIEVIPGFSVLPSMSFAERRKMVQQITGMTGAPSENIDEYLGIPIPCTRVIMHPCSVRSKVPHYDRRSGEEYYPLEPATRIVFQRSDSTKMLAFVSAAIRGFVETYILPVFGPGPWEEPINIKFRQVSTSNGGRTYQAQVVE